jgi:hypothetical protein
MSVPPLADSPVTARSAMAAAAPVIAWTGTSTRGTVSNETMPSWSWRARANAMAPSAAARAMAILGMFPPRSFMLPDRSRTSSSGAPAGPEPVPVTGSAAGRGVPSYQVASRLCGPPRTSRPRPLARTAVTRAVTWAGAIDPLGTSGNSTASTPR